METIDIQSLQSRKYGWPNNHSSIFQCERNERKSIDAGLQWRATESKRRVQVRSLEGGRCRRQTKWILVNSLRTIVSKYKRLVLRMNLSYFFRFCLKTINFIDFSQSKRLPLSTNWNDLWAKLSMPIIGCPTNWYCWQTAHLRWTANLFLKFTIKFGDILSKYSELDSRQTHQRWSVLEWRRIDDN